MNNYDPEQVTFFLGERTIATRTIPIHNSHPFLFDNRDNVTDFLYFYPIKMGGNYGWELSGWELSYNPPEALTDGIIPPDARLAITLYRLARGDSIYTIEHVFGYFLTNCIFHFLLI